MESKNASNTKINQFIIPKKNTISFFNNDLFIILSIVLVFIIY